MCEEIWTRTAECRDAKIGRQNNRQKRGGERRPAIKILKLALLTTLRIAFFGSLKVALLAYTLFLSIAALTGSVQEDEIDTPAPHNAPQGIEHTSGTVLTS